MNWELRKKQEKEFDELRNIVEDVFRVPLITKGRHRCYVTSRMVFSRVLVDRGHSKKSIGRYLNRNHSTVVHYCKKFEDYYTRDKELTAGYDDVMSCLKGKYDPVRKFTPPQLVKRVFRLQDQNAKLKEAIRNLEKSGALSSRFETLYSDIAQRTPLGREEDVAKAIMKALNGVLSE
jgi:IS30 family transposase